jgi:hypothetical protein
MKSGLLLNLICRFFQHPEINPQPRWNESKPGILISPIHKKSFKLFSTFVKTFLGTPSVTLPRTRIEGEKHKEVRHAGVPAR